MNINEPSVFSPVRLVKAEQTDRNRLLTMLTDELSDNRLEYSEAFLLNGDNEIYLAHSEKTQKTGHIIVTDYPKVKDSKEIMLYCFDISEEQDTLRGALSAIIKILSDENKASFLYLKVPESKKQIAEIVETVGFIKEGLFISNQFLQGEFSFYSVFRYELKRNPKELISPVNAQ